MPSPGVEGVALFLVVAVAVVDLRHAGRSRSSFIAAHTMPSAPRVVKRPPAFVAGDHESFSARWRTRPKYDEEFC